MHDQQNLLSETAHLFGSLHFSLPYPDYVVSISHLMFIKFAGKKKNDTRDLTNKFLNWKFIDMKILIKVFLS